MLQRRRVLQTIVCFITFLSARRENRENERGKHVLWWDLFDRNHQEIAMLRITAVSVYALFWAFSALLSVEDGTRQLWQIVERSPRRKARHRAQTSQSKMPKKLPGDPLVVKCKEAQGKCKTAKSHFRTNTLRNIYRKSR